MWKALRAQGIFRGQGPAPGAPCQSQGRSRNDGRRQEEHPGPRGRVGVPLLRLGHHQEQGQPGGDQGRAAPVHPCRPAAVQGDAEGNSEEQAAHQERLDQDQGAV